MEDGQVSGSIGDTCQVCKMEASRYRCPGCQKQSCSLECVQRHKTETPCSGKRTRAAMTFVPHSKLTPDILEDDFSLLTEANESNERLARLVPKQRNNRHPLIIAVKKTLSLRATTLELMPPIMARAKANKTRMLKDIISWTVEWIILKSLPEHPVNMTFDDLRKFVSETKYSQCLESEKVLESFSKLGILPAEEDQGELVILLRQEPDQHTTKRLWPLHSLVITWNLLLSNRKIIEFPTMYICYIK